MKPFDPLLNIGLRFGVMSLLIKLKSASFVYLKKELNATQGNLSVQLEKLQQGGYINIHKGFKGKYPETNCSVTQKGVNAFEAHVKNLKKYLHL
jgi:DNA-binding MarR family transcriptional regulator